jgi:hypothetical protein
MLISLSYCSYHGGIYETILVGGLIVLLSLILLTSAHGSIYGYSHNGAESRNETHNNNSPARSTTRSCDMTDNTIKCSNILNETGHFVANYINENSNSVSTCS